MKLHYSDGVGFAIPIDNAIQIISQLRKYKKLKRPYIGLAFGTVVVNRGDSVSIIVLIVT